MCLGILIEILRLYEFLLFRFRAEPKRWIRVTASVGVSLLDNPGCRARCEEIALVTILGAAANRARRGVLDACLTTDARYDSY